jgi:quercetin dioxygenase-like cupin family protein
MRSTDGISETYLLGGSQVTLLRTDQQTGGAFCLMHITKPAGFATVPHAHSLEWEAIYVLSGELQVEMAGATWTVEPGDLQAFPADVPHRLSNASPQPATYLQICAPAGFDDFVREVGVLRHPNAGPGMLPTPAELRRLREAAPRHGITFLPEAALDARRNRCGPMPRQRIDALGVQIEILAEREETGYGSALLTVTLPPRATIPLHSHAYPELFYLSSGRLDYYRLSDGVGGWTTLTPGSTIDIAAGVGHALNNPSDKPAMLVVVSSRARLDFLRAVAHPAGSMSPLPTPDEVGRLLARENRVVYWSCCPNSEAYREARPN